MNSQQEQEFAADVKEAFRKHESAVIEECAKIVDALGDEAESSMKEFRARGLSIACYAEEEMNAHRKAAKEIRKLAEEKTNG